MLKRVDIALLPAEALEMEADAYVVVDVLRATTTIAMLFHSGLKDVVVMDDIERTRARAFAEARLLFGEVGGLRPDGFDYGNSPVEAAGAEVEGRGAALFTTNGTPALCALGSRGVVYAGALANAGALARQLRRHERVVFVCAGTAAGKRFALEDFAATGLLVRELQEHRDRFEMGDAAMIAARMAGTPTRTLDVSLGTQTSATIPRTMPSFGQTLVSTSDHARRLRDLGLESDVRFCARLNTSRAVPMVVECGDGWARLENPP